MPTSNLYTYQTDILGDAYQQMTLNFADDYDGKVIATLIRKKQHKQQRRQFYISTDLLIISFKKKWLSNSMTMVMIFTPLI